MRAEWPARAGAATPTRPGGPAQAGCPDRPAPAGPGQLTCARRGLVLGGLLLLTGCGGRPGRSRLAALRDRGVARIAVAGEEPFGFVDGDGVLTGAMPQIAAAVLGRLGIASLHPVLVPFNRLIDTVLAGRADLVGAGMSVNPQRCRRVAFARPDFRLPQALCVPGGNPQGLSDYRSVAARRSVRLGVLDGAVEADYARVAGVPTDRLLRFAEPEALITALVSGDIGAFGLTSLSVRRLIARAGDGVLAAGPSFTPVVDGQPRVERGAMAFRPSDGDLLGAYDDVAAELRGSGALASILRDWGFHDDEVATGAEPAGCPG